MSSGSGWSRRRFLQAAGITGASAALAPFVPTLRASASPPARRLVCFAAPMGSALDAWRDNGGGAPLVSGAPLPALAGPVLGALAGLEDRIAVLDGVDLAAVTSVYGGDPAVHTVVPSHGHPSDADFVGPYLAGGHHATVSVFTGTSGVPMARFEPVQWTACESYLTATGPSLDTYVHERQRTTAPWLQTAALNCYEAFPDQRYNQHVASYGMPSAPGEAAPWNYPSTDPRAVFDRLFGALGTGTDRRTLGRRRVLDQVRGEMTRLRAELPTEDRDRLDMHHESLAQLDARLAGSGMACTLPAAPDARSDWATRADPLGTARAMYEVIRLAFECDLMRSVSFMIGEETQGDDPRIWVPSAPSYDVVGTLHQVSHDQDQPDRRDIMIAYNRAQVASFAELVRTLQSGANTFEDTIVAWGGVQSDTLLHNNLNPIWMIAAGASTPIRTGRYLRWGTYDSSWVWIPRGGIPHNRVLTTLAHGMGYTDVTTFGSTSIPSSCTYEDDGYSYVCPETGALDHSPIEELLS